MCTVLSEPLPQELVCACRAVLSVPADCSDVGCRLHLTTLELFKRLDLKSKEGFQKPWEIMRADFELALRVAGALVFQCCRISYWVQ